MRRMLALTYAAYLFIVGSAFPQEDSVLSFLPLQIGNVWQYKVHFVVNNSNIDTTYYSLFTVTRDTIMPNGYQYQVIENDMETQYVHIDSITYCVFNYEYNSTVGIMTDSLNCSEGDWFGNGIYCEQIDTSTILGYRTTIMDVNKSAPDYSEGHTLAMDIGKATRMISTSAGFGTIKTYDLVYAKINGNEFGELVSHVNNTTGINEFSLYQNYPNPFNPNTTIKYVIPELSLVTLKVFNVLGNEIATLVTEEKSAGTYEVKFDGRDLASGFYLYQLQMNSLTETKKMLILK